VVGECSLVAGGEGDEGDFFGHGSPFPGQSSVHSSKMNGPASNPRMVGP
jgi:hypothetical protein